MKRNLPATTERLGPGEYVPDPTEGVQRIEDLPKPKRLSMQRNFHHTPCPRCGQSAARKRTFQRHLHDLGDVFAGRPQEITLTYSQHYCPHCACYFNADMQDLAFPGSRYTQRVIQLAVRLVVEDGLPYRTASWHLWRDHRVFVPFATLQNWVEASEKKSLAMLDAYLGWALSDFSGYISADEMYDGPFCVLSIVDNRVFPTCREKGLDKSPKVVCKLSN